MISNSIYNIEGFLLSSHVAASIDLLNGKKGGDPITSRVFSFTSNAQNCLSQRGALQPQSASTKSCKPNSGHQLPSQPPSPFQRNASYGSKSTAISLGDSLPDSKLLRRCNRKSPIPFTQPQPQNHCAESIIQPQIQQAPLLRR